MRVEACNKPNNDDVHEDDSNERKRGAWSVVETNLERVGGKKEFQEKWKRMEWISSKVSNRGAVHDGAVRYDSRFDQRLHRVSAAVWV